MFRCFCVCGKLLVSVLACLVNYQFRCDVMVMIVVKTDMGLGGSLSFDAPFCDLGNDF